MKRKIELLLRIHKLIGALGSSPQPLDCVSRDLLMVVSEAEQDGSPLKVSDVRFNPRFGSEATALKRLQKLLANGWIVTSSDQTDERIKRLSLSTMANKELEQIADKLLRTFKKY